MAKDLSMMPATELVRNYRKRALSPLEVTRAALERIAAGNDALNACVLTCEEEAMRQARASERRWARGAPLSLVDGVPTTVKDLMDLKGYPTRRGSLTTPATRARDDAPAVAALRRHGAVFVAKTTTPEFGWKGLTDSPLSGITRNPWDTSKTSGGSSGGAGAGVAVGMGALALGSDGGGSIRMPASFCGVFGLKPTAGRVPYYPLSAVGTCSSIGPMTRTVSDAALMLQAMAEPDGRDWCGVLTPAPDYGRAVRGGIEGLRIAYSPDLGYAKVDAQVARGVAAAVKVLRSLGARVSTLGRVFADPRRAYEDHFRIGMSKVYRTLDARRRRQLDPGFRKIAQEGMKLRLEDAARSEAVRAELAVAVNLLLDRYDLLITPQLTLTAFDAAREYPAGRGMRRWMDWAPFTWPFNFTGHPAASVPCGFDSAGLPVSFQIVGQRLADDVVLRAARAYERERPFRMPALPAA